jgi:hypothetical protein
VTEAQARELISATFVTGWTAAHPTIPFALENEVRPDADAFAQLTIQLTVAGQMTQGAAGTRRERHNGWINVKLWTLANIGTASPATADGRGPRATDLTETVRSVFRMRELASPVAGDEPITTGSPVPQPIGTDARWYMCLVRTPFWYVQTV